MQKARRQPGRTIGLRLLVGARVQVSFTPLTGVLFTFPSRYWYAIGRWLVFRLGEWSPQIPTGFHVPCGTQEPSVPFSISLTGLSPSMVGLSRPVQLSSYGSRAKALQPQTTEVAWFGLFPVRSPLLGESLLISLPSGTEMFHFPEFCPAEAVYRFYL